MAKLNIIVGTHGHFGEELVKSAELITGKFGHCLCFRRCPLRIS